MLHYMGENQQITWFIYRIGVFPQTTEIHPLPPTIFNIILIVIRPYNPFSGQMERIEYAATATTDFQNRRHFIQNPAIAGDSNKVLATFQLIVEIAACRTSAAIMYISVLKTVIVLVGSGIKDLGSS